MQKRQHVTPAFAFDRMLEYIKQGWVGNDGFAMGRDHLGRVCSPEISGATSFDLVGSYYRAVHKHPGLARFRIEIMAAFTLALQERMRREISAGNVIYQLTRFNDTPERTKAEIVELLQLARQKALDAMEEKKHGIALRNTQQ